MPSELSVKNTTKANSQPASPVFQQLQLVPLRTNQRLTLPRTPVLCSPIPTVPSNPITVVPLLMNLQPASIVSLAPTNVQNEASPKEQTSSYKCSLCSAILRRKNDLNRHMQFSHNPNSNPQDDSKAHSCHYCGYRCKRKHDIKRHIFSVHLKLRSGSKIACSVCELSFQDESTLRQHVMKLHFDSKEKVVLAVDKGDQAPADRNCEDRESETNGISKTHSCRICNSSYTRKSDYYRHLRNKHPSEFDTCEELIASRKKVPVNCPYCDETTVNRISILQHIKSVHNVDIDTPFICVPCNKAFKRKASLNAHNDTYHPPEQSQEEVDLILKTSEILVNGEKAFHCGTCNRNMFDPMRFIAHVRLHNVERRFVCDLCGKQTRTKNQLNSHVKFIHLNVRPFECERCHKSFKSRQSHDEHVRIHTGERPFSCEICGKTFIALNALLTHQKFHNDFYAHACTMCPKKFKVRRQLTMHIYTHTKERPFRCDLCSKTFNNSSRFSYHKKVTHSDNRPFKCSQCGSYFKANKFLKRHMKLHDVRTQIQFRRRNNPSYFETQKATCGEKSRSKRKPNELSQDKLIGNTFDVVGNENDREETGSEGVKNKDLASHIEKKV